MATRLTNHKTTSVLIASLALSLLPISAEACNRKVNVEHFGQRIGHAKSDKEAGWLHFVKFRQIIQTLTGTDYKSDIDTFVSGFAENKDSEPYALALSRLVESADCGGQDAIKLMQALGTASIIKSAGITQSQVQSAIDDYVYKVLRQRMIQNFGRQIVSVAMQRLGPRTQFATVSMRYTLTEKPNCTLNEAGDNATCQIKISLDIRDEVNSSVTGIHGDLSNAMRSLGSAHEYDGVINLSKPDGKWAVRGSPFG